MSRKRRWIWVVLFVCVALLVGLLATVWNVVLVHDYHKMLELAHELAQSDPLLIRQPRGPWWGVTLGSIGFGAVLAMLILFFVRLLREMRLNQLQSEFLSAVTHELKTPIASLELSSSLLRSADLTPAEQDRLWQSHSSELKRLREEVETLLESARWQSASPFHLDPETLSLAALIDHSRERWARILGPEGKLRIEGEKIDELVFADRKVFHLITDNLVDNARKFAKDIPELTVRVSRQGRGWSLRFEDAGRGFDAAEARKIFHRFYRGKTNAPYAIPGNGLGLHLALTASRGCGMRLTGESPGRELGATFVLEGKFK